MARAGKTRVALIVTAAVMLLRLPVAWLIQHLFPNASSDPAAYYAALIIQESVLWGLPALIMRPWKTPRLPQGKLSAGLCAMAVAVGAVAQAALIPVTAWWSGLIGAEQGAVLLPENEIQWVLAVTALAVVPALAEEVFFRGGLMTGLREGIGPIPTLGLTTVIFALMHGSLAGVPAHLVISLLCGLGMMCRGRLLVSVLMHMSYNGAALLLRSVDASLLPSLPLGVLLMAAAVWMVTEIRWRGAHGRLKLGDAVLLGVILLGTAALYLPQILT